MTSQPTFTALLMTNYNRALALVQHMLHLSAKVKQKSFHTWGTSVNAAAGMQVRITFLWDISARLVCTNSKSQIFLCATTCVPIWGLDAVSDKLLTGVLSLQN